MSNWKKRIYSDELSGENAPRDFMKEAIGRTIIDEDNVPHRVVEIVQSKWFPWMLIINEQDPYSKAGYFVHTLSFCAQILGKPLPTKDQKDAFNRTCQVELGVGEGYIAQPEPPQFKRKSPIHLLK